MKHLLFVFLVFSVFSCIPHKKLIYLKPGQSDAVKIENFQTDSAFQYRVQPGDILGIEISSTVATQVEIFNKKFEGDRQSSSAEENGYIVDSKGNIELPLIGNIQVNKLTVYEITNALKLKLNEYIDYAFVKVSILNSKVSILGEVKAPGQYKITGSGITIFQALSMAGDLTDYANRRKVKLIRKVGTVTKLVNLDISNKDIINSDYYYLSPNDVIYVEPLKLKSLRANSASVSLILSSLTIILLIIRLAR